LLEIDLRPRGREPTAMDCTWQVGDFDPANLQAFRRQYPGGDSFVVTSDVERSFARTYSDLSVRFVSPVALIQRLQGARGGGEALAR